MGSHFSCFYGLLDLYPLQINISRDFGVIHRTLNAEESVVQDIYDRDLTLLSKKSHGGLMSGGWMSRG